MPKITPRKLVTSSQTTEQESHAHESTESMAKRRKPIGRRLGSPLLSDDSNIPSQIYTLSSGRQVEFSYTKVNSSDLEALTYIDPLVNGREQNALTQASVADLCETIVHQQFFPAIGRRDQTERIEILDGSRRRAAALFTGSDLEILVTNAQLSLEEAQRLASAIQTAREHNLREVGLRLQHLLEVSGLTQAQLATAQGLSPAKVTRALQAASVSVELLSVFPDQSELTYPDYRFLKELGDRLKPKRLTALVGEVKEATHQLSDDLPSDQYKLEVMRCYQKLSSTKRSQSSQEKVEISPLWNFKDKNAYARKRVKGRTLHFEFNRIPNELQIELETAINEVLARHLKES